MLGLERSRTQIRSPGILDRLFLGLLVYLYVFLSHAHVLPVYVTSLSLREEAHNVKAAEKNGESFTQDFASALVFVAVAVMIGTILVCVFAHCWRQILDCSRGGKKKSVARKWRSKEEEEVWFCKADRGLPMPQFDVLEPETEPLTLSMLDAVPDWNLEVYNGYCATYMPDLAAGSRTGSKTRWDSSPSWIDSEEIERPASVAYLLNRP